MGNSNKKQSKAIVVGLDNSGKSTIINFLKPEPDKSHELYATVGFQVEKFKYQNTQFTMYDMSGQGKYRDLWQHYYSEAMGIIYVVDAADTVRMCVVKDELDQLLGHAEIAKSRIPLLFFANKCDLPQSLTASQLSEALELEKIRDRPWHIVGSNALSGQGLEEGIKWITVKMAAPTQKGVAG